VKSYSGDLTTKIVFACILILVPACWSCGGGNVTPPPPSVADFTVSISPTELSVISGKSTSNISISVAGRNGFTGSVSVTLSGLPAGATTEPVGPITIAEGASQSFVIDIPSSAPAGISSVQATATSGSLSHSAQFAVAVNPFVTPAITTFDDGTSFVLQSQTATETVRVGLLQAWGAAITEIGLNGVDYVNNDDPGRQIQTSLWDENINYSIYCGYNPIESGDHFFQGSPVLASVLLPDGSIYTKTQPIQWAPENFGGGPGNPVLR
jgi:hypothetical protein